ncbi:hypothetical protein GCM10010400_08110 [Streptomyces aculeolatus]
MHVLGLRHSHQVADAALLQHAAKAPPLTVGGLKAGSIPTASDFAKGAGIDHIHSLPDSVGQGVDADRALPVPPPPGEYAEAGRHHHTARSPFRAARNPLGPVSKVPPAPRRLARHLAALSGSTEYSPVCGRPSALRCTAPDAAAPALRADDGTFDTGPSAVAA